MEPPRQMRQRIVIHGLVQGVGLRPYLCRIADKLGLSGWVQNTVAGAVIEIQGSPSQMIRFQSEFGTGPASARIESVQITNCPLVQEQSFVIRPSTTDASGVTCPPVDLAPCAECLAEFRSADDRRRNYPFINCTACGPRFTILKDMPFDRPRTSMNSFPFCEQCQTEYRDPQNRRFHAQAMACPDCGPQMNWYEAGGETLFGDAAIFRAKKVLTSGGVIALKGVGGFHLITHATNPEAIARLRQIKRRAARPLALLASCLEMVREFAMVDDVEADWLQHPTRPIVLLTARQNAAIPFSVAPALKQLGFMLPYTPLQYLLIESCPLVFTSGNRSGDPLICHSDEAKQQLGSLVDGILDHNRRIEVRCDDSVLQVVQQQPRMIRRSRGFVPNPLKLKTDGPCVLAVGGEFKNAPALAVGDRIYPGPHVGDLQGWLGIQALDDAVTHLCRLLHAKPEAITCDAHPGYLSHRWAKEYAQRQRIPLIPVYHHEAHAAAWQLDSDRQNSTALVVVFDGTGLGPDGTLWGSEFFCLPETGPAKLLAHLTPVALPGGEIAVRKPARLALSHMHAIGLPTHLLQANTPTLSESERQIVLTQIERKLSAPLTRSMGRLFDAVASLLDVSQEATYEGQPAIELEAIAEPTDFRLPEFALTPGPATLTVNPGPVLIGMIEAFTRKISRSELAFAFHVSVATMIVSVLLELRRKTGTTTVGFSGGVFQNRLLETLLTSLLREANFEAQFHSQLPCNDGGLASGQAVLARRFLRTQADSTKI